MTCIAAIISNDVITIASDMLVTWDYSVNNYTDKIFRKGNGYVVGCSGGVRVSQLMQYEVTFPVIPKNVKDLKEFIVKKVVPNIRKVMRKELAKKNMDESDLNSAFLIGVKGGLFIITEDYCVLEFDKFAAIGSGAIAALASLSTTEEVKKDFDVGIPDAQRLAYALNSAHEVENTVGEDNQVVAIFGLTRGDEED